jgi:hypothetical protein
MTHAVGIGRRRWRNLAQAASTRVASGAAMPALFRRLAHRRTPILGMERQRCIVEGARVICAKIALEGNGWRASLPKTS